MAIALAVSVTLYPTTCKAFSSVRLTKIWSYIRIFSFLGTEETTRALRLNSCVASIARGIG